MTAAQFVAPGVCIPVSQLRYVAGALAVALDTDVRNGLAVDPEIRKTLVTIDSVLRGIDRSRTAPRGMTTAEHAARWSISERQALRRLKASGAEPSGHVGRAFLWLADVEKREN